MVQRVGSETQWRGEQDTAGRRRLWRWVAVSALLHLPVSPLAPWLGLLALFGTSPPPPPRDLNEITAIPVDLVTEPTGEQAPQAEEPSPPEAPPKELSMPEIPKLESLLLHADRGFKFPDAGAQPDAGEEAEPADAGAGDAGDGGVRPRLPNPIALAGVAGAIADKNAPVSIAVYNENIRQQRLGAKVGEILARVYQWRDFFGPTGLDPVRDIDRMLIAGPEFNDSSRVVAVLRYHVSDAKMKAALDRIVKSQPGGKWLEGKVPVASATADRAGRLFVMPAPHLMVVAPPSAKKSALALPRTLSQKRDPFPGPKGDEVMVAYLATPWAAFAQAHIPIKVPQSIKSATVVLTPTEQGGLSAKVEAEDESAEAAQQHAAELAQTVRAAARVGRGVLRFSAIDRVKFWAEGAIIHGEITATPDQVALALAFIEPMVTPPEPEPTPAASTPPPAASAPAPAPSASSREPATRASAVPSAAIPRPSVSTVGEEPTAPPAPSAR
jgi:hypothetical protein